MMEQARSNANNWAFLRDECECEQMIRKMWGNDEQISANDEQMTS